MGLRHKSVVYVHSADEIPTVEHWAVIKSSSVHVGDVGVWAPGHGYPAHDERFIEYEAYTDKAEFEDEVKSLAEQRFGKSYRLLHIQPLVAKTTVTVQVGRP